ncbi:hypothetical protein HPB47_019766 [Ixodes persulcatus]|uniref:Uncharacterized protein n=1 Tax=Ixodes persulcatus TaxID=34615 RepID=A0AC60QH65_IXOPE|nr:hypothetical protein HPB47_019766 [Ixodes persulcatus]
MNAAEIPPSRSAEADYQTRGAIWGRRNEPGSQFALTNIQHTRSTRKHASFRSRRIGGDDPSRPAPAKHAFYTGELVGKNRSLLLSSPESLCPSPSVSGIA